MSLWRNHISPMLARNNGSNVDMTSDLSGDSRDYAVVPVTGPGEMRGVEVRGTPGKDCWIGFRSDEPIAADVTIMFMGAKPCDRVSIVLGAIGVGKVVISVRGSDAHVSVGHSKMLSAVVNLGVNADVKVGDDTTAGNMTINAKHGRITIGQDCMISGQVQMDVSKHHSVVDLSGPEPRIETDPQDMQLGNHVWVGHSATLLGNSKIGDGSIIGHSAVVAGKVPSNCIAAGNPARVIRKDATWTRYPHSFDPKTQSYLDSLPEAQITSTTPSDAIQAGHAFSKGSHT